MDDDTVLGSPMRYSFALCDMLRDIKRESSTPVFHKAEMKCPHCAVAVHESWNHASMSTGGKTLPWRYRSMKCPECRDLILQIGESDSAEIDWKLYYPSGSNRGPAFKEVPPEIASDYVESCNVLSVSAKASAALARRCLQAMLHAHGYKRPSLAHEIDALLAEADPLKAIPLTLRTVVDGIRNFGNFSAHPLPDQTTLQIIDVEPDEAEWCLEIIEEAFQHFYVRPADAIRRKAALNAKLLAAGKPLAK